ncbi:hypothetical protein G6F35_015676 [Rhizopus arrhizus]|nr:hypothetical protein G6F35_015676 [Rhizopus arrhizus]
MSALPARSRLARWAPLLVSAGLAVGATVVLRNHALPVIAGPFRPSGRDGDEPAAGHQPAVPAADAAEHRRHPPARARPADAGAGQSRVLALGAARVCAAAQPAVAAVHRAGTDLGFQPTAQPLVVGGVCRSWGWPDGWAAQGSLQVRPCKLGRRIHAAHSPAQPPHPAAGSFRVRAPRVRKRR